MSVLFVSPCLCLYFVLVLANLCRSNFLLPHDRIAGQRGCLWRHLGDLQSPHCPHQLSLRHPKLFGGCRNFRNTQNGMDEENQVLENLVNYHCWLSPGSFQYKQHGNMRPTLLDNDSHFKCSINGTDCQ